MFLHFKTTSFIWNKQAFRDFKPATSANQVVGLGINDIKFQLHQNQLPLWGSPILLLK